MPGWVWERAVTLKDPTGGSWRGLGWLSANLHALTLLPPRVEVWVELRRLRRRCPSLQEPAVCPARSSPLEEKPKQAAWRRQRFSWALDAWKGRGGGRALQAAQSKVSSSPWYGAVAPGPPLDPCFCSFQSPLRWVTPRHHFIKEDTEAQRGQGPGPKPETWEPGLQPRENRTPRPKHSPQPCGASHAGLVCQGGW